MAIIGGKQVGKSSFINRFIKGSFNKTIAPTTSFSYTEKILTLPHNPNIRVNVCLTDTQPYENWGTSTVGPFISNCVFFLLFDLTNKASFDEMEGLINDCNYKAKDPLVQKILIGAKSDISPTSVSQD